MAGSVFGSFLVYSPNNHSGIKGLIWRSYLNVVGTPDLHSHLRWRAVKTLLPCNVSSVLDVGCGSGIMTFEVSSMFEHSVEVVGMDLDFKSIATAMSIKQNLGLSNCSFLQHDANAGLPFGEETFDLVLLIDIIEHLSEDDALMKEVYRVLRGGGMVIVSVPTPNYPRFFGYEFHREIGHVRDGYWYNDLVRMFTKYNITIEKCVVHTFVPSALVCAVYYRYLRRIKAAPFTPVLKPLAILFDSLWPFRSEKYACSLVVRGRK